MVCKCGRVVQRLFIYIFRKRPPLPHPTATGQNEILKYSPDNSLSEHITLREVKYSDGSRGWDVGFIYEKRTVIVTEIVASNFYCVSVKKCSHWQEMSQSHVLCSSPVPSRRYSCHNRCSNLFPTLSAAFWVF